MRAAPRISVLIPTYNRCERLHRVLVALAEQTADPESFEVVVVSDGSDDGTDAYLGSGNLPIEIVPIFQPNRGPAAARNAAIAASEGELLLFLDDDVVPGPGLVDEHLGAHDRHPDSVIIGPMLTPPDHPMTPWVRWEQDMLYKQYDAMERGLWTATARQFYTGNASLLREHVVACGGFDESLRRAEDVELAFRLAELGVGFHYVPSAVGYHYAERSYAAWCQIADAYGRNDVAFAREPGRAWLAPFMARTFRRHHVVVRVFTRICVRWRRADRAVEATLRRIATVGELLGASKISNASLSIIYSIRYHCGVADELDGSGNFRALLVTGQIPGHPRPRVAM